MFGTVKSRPVYLGRRPVTLNRRLLVILSSSISPLVTSFCPPPPLPSCPCHLTDSIHPLRRQLLLLSDGFSILDPAPATAPSKMDPLLGTHGTLQSRFRSGWRGPQWETVCGLPLEGLWGCLETEKLCVGPAVLSPPHPSLSVNEHMSKKRGGYGEVNFRRNT